MQDLHIIRHTLLSPPHPSFASQNPPSPQGEGFCGGGIYDDAECPKGHSARRKLFSSSGGGDAHTDSTRIRTHIRKRTSFCHRHQLSLFLRYLGSCIFSSARSKRDSRGSSSFSFSFSVIRTRLLSALFYVVLF